LYCIVLYKTEYTQSAVNFFSDFFDQSEAMAEDEVDNYVNSTDCVVRDGVLTPTG